MARKRESEGRSRDKVNCRTEREPSIQRVRPRRRQPWQGEVPGVFCGLGRVHSLKRTASQVLSKVRSARREGRP